jgi:hypothetical protein
VTGRHVEAVWLWRHGTTPFRATYGRLPDRTYTKDYLQLSGDCANAMDQVFGLSRRGGRASLRYVWPGAVVVGELIAATDDEPPSFRRLNLRWQTNEPPEPWRLFPSGSSSSLRTFPGDPHLTDPTAANQELVRFQTLHTDPWLVATKLKDESDILHLRAYMGSPPTDRRFASTDNLPKAVRRQLGLVDNRRQCAVIQTRDLPVADRHITFDPEVVHAAWSEQAPGPRGNA